MDIGSSGFTRPDANDQRGWLWVVTILSIIYSTAFLGVRFFIKYGQLGMDDLAAGVAYVIAFAQWGATMKAFKVGLGAFLGNTARLELIESSLAQLTYWSRILLLCSHWLAKGSLVMFTRRVFSGDMNHEKMIFIIAFAATAVSGLAAIFVNSIGCSAGSLVEGYGAEDCPKLATRWIIVCVLDLVSELVLIVLPGILLVPVQICSAKKRKVCMYYSFRFGVIAFSIAQTISFLEFVRDGRPSIGYTRPLIFSELLLCYSLISATIPCMRTFVGAFAGHSLSLQGRLSTNAGSHGAGESFHLRTIRSTKASGRALKADNASEQEHLNSRPGAQMYNVSVEHASGVHSSEQLSMESDVSDQVIIRRDLHVYVNREE